MTAATQALLLLAGLLLAGAPVVPATKADDSAAACAQCACPAGQCGCCVRQGAPLVPASPAAPATSGLLKEIRGLPVFHALVPGAPLGASTPASAAFSIPPRTPGVPLYVRDCAPLL